MKKIGGFLVSRWFLTGLGALLIAVLIWLFGPSIATGQAHPLDTVPWRILAIAVVFMIWLLSNLRREMKAAKQDKALVEAVAAPATDPTQTATAEEMAILSDRLRQALQDLRGKGRFRRQRLYQLPWYMFIGPPGAGKTTALINSGLDFPLADKGSTAGLKGVGGTRNCDWWFTDQAVLIDTAGRYTTQDSHEAVDSAAWLGFLGLLKRYRRRQPLNGVLVAISLSDLAVFDTAGRLAHAQAIRRRLRELHDQFGVRVPAYVLFTKADLIAGFVEFFDDLGKEEREQVWGMTLPLDAGKGETGAVAGFAGEFDALVARLNDRMLERVHQEPDAQRRGLIYGFPQQVASLREVAEEFLTEIFRPSRIEAKPLLRGVYFTSGTQDGTPIDRLLGAMAGHFGLQRQAVSAFSGTGRSYFLSRLLREVVFGEAGVVSLDIRYERRQRWLYAGAYAAAALVLLGATAVWATSYLGNRDLIARMAAGLQRYRQQYAALEKAPGSDTDVLPVLAPLDTLRDLPGGYAQLAASPPAALTFGLYQGQRLGARASDAYRHALNMLLLPRLLARLEQQMRANLDKPDFLYEALKTYLILGRRGPLDRGLVKDWTDADFANAYPADGQAPLRAELAGDVTALLEQPVTAMPLNGPLVEQVRNILRQQPPALRSYVRIMRSEQVRDLPPWRLIDHAGAAAEQVLVLRSGKKLADEAIPGIYTWAGYHDTFLHLLPEVTDDVAEDSWVLGQQETVAKDKVALLRRDVLNLYYDDYIRQWDALLADVAIKPFATLSQGLDALNTLSGPNSPFRTLLTDVDHETQLAREDTGEKAGNVLEQVGAKQGARMALKQLSVRQKELAFALGTALKPGEAPVDPATRVDDHFKALHDFVGSPGHPGQMEAVLSKMAALYTSFNQTASAPNAAAAMLGAVAAPAAGGSLSAQLASLAKTLPQPMAAMVATVSQSSASVTAAGARQQIIDAWKSNVMPLCTAATAGRYPFVTSSSTDVPLDDFSHLLGPGGLIDQYFAQYLKPFVDTTTRPWKWQASDNTQLGLSAAVLQQFQYASEIRDGLFPGGPTPKVDFTITPVSLDPGVAQVTLNIDGQSLTYNHGPMEPTHMVWPGPGGGPSRLTFVPAAGGNGTIVEKSGSWSLFRLFDTARVTPSGQPDHFTLTFSSPAGNASFAVAAGSVMNPFTMPALHQFRCPSL